jgi:CelD/BcsL family acetyltransferase involved in cellulose biosynthesis
VSVHIAAQLEIDELTTTPSLEALRPEWSALWLRCGSAAPFQSPEWLLPWWRRFGSGLPYVLAIRRNGRLVGVVPLYSHPGAASRERTLVPIGVGVSDDLDPLFDPQFSDEAAEATLAHLAERDQLWNQCVFQQLPAGSPLLTAAPPLGLIEETTVQDACPVLRIPELVGGLSDCLPGGQMKKLLSSRRRAGREGVVRIERATQAGFESLFETVLRLHSARWTARALPGVLADSAVQDFHREAAWNLLRLGALRMYLLRIGDRPVASFYGFTRGKRAAYLGGFDPAYKQLSPGMLVVGHAIEEAIREGAEEVDFLRGREAYKYAWGAEDRLNYRRRFSKND